MAFLIAALVVMAVLGALFGLGLAIAANKFRVDVDPRVEEVIDALPGINCGACGFAGCAAYAKAVVAGAAPNLCIPGGPETAAALAAIMGVAVEEPAEPVRAVVHCQGGVTQCAAAFEYDGIADCRAAALIQAGDKACTYGCLGMGTCTDACPFHAVTMGEDRLPVIDWDKCTGCGACIKACPRGLCQVVPASTRVIIACSSQGKGKEVKQACQVGCIACWLCVKKSPEGAIEKNSNLPKLTYPEGVDYAEAAEKCPMNCFVKTPAAAPEPVSAQAPS